MDIFTISNVMMVSQEYTCQNLSSCKLYVQFIVCQLHLHKVLFKKIKKKLTAAIYLELSMLGCFSGCIMFACFYFIQSRNGSAKRSHFPSFLGGRYRHRLSSSQ